MRRARLWSYVAWQARDFAFERGAPLVIVAMLMISPIIMTLWRLRERAPEALRTDGAAGSAILQVLTRFALITVLIGINGVVSNDRVRGYYRFLFAKPVSIPRYYAQAYGVNGLGLLTTAFAVCAVIYMVGYPLSPWRVLLAVGLMYVSLGGLGFFYSTVARFDWLLMGGTFAVAHLVRAMFPPQLSRAGEIMHVVLPPFHRLEEVGTQLARGDSVDPALLAWMLGWGISAFVLGLLILRRRPLAT